MKYVLVGFGNMGRNHYRVLNNHFPNSIMAIIDPQKNIKNKPNISFFGDFNEFIQSKINVDAAILAVPTDLHLSYAKDFLDHGINVFIEKPISNDIDESLKIINYSKNKNLKIFVGHVERYNPAVLKAKELIDQQILGKIYMITSSRVGIKPSLDPLVPVSIDLLVHDVDVVNYILSDYCNDANLFEMNCISKNRSDVATLMANYNNILISLHANWVTPFKQRILSFAGEKGYLTIDYITQKINFLKTQESSDGILELVTSEFNAPYKEPLLNEHLFFRDYIKNNVGYDPIHAYKAIEIIKRARNDY